MAAPDAIAANPVLFIVIFAIFAPLLWWKWRVVGNSTKRALSDQTHGLRVGADMRDVAHDTGVGTKQMLVMRRNKVGGTIWFGLAFFGGGALFYWFVVLQSEPTSENWLTFAGLAAFSIAIMGLIEANQTRIIVDDSGLERRRVLRKRERLKFSDISSVETLGNSFRNGLVIRTTSAKRMKIPAAFSGYADLMVRLAPHDPHLALTAKLYRAKAA